MTSRSSGIEPRGTMAYVAVGSNIDPERHIPEALRALGERVAVAATSTFYLSEPKARPGQPKFYNGVWQIATGLPPERLKFDVLRDIEAALGRRRTEDKLAPREIDLDLILYGERVVETPGLTLPDPDIYRYGFIAVPLAELAPDLVLPKGGGPVAMLESATDKGDLLALEAFSSQLKRWLTT